MRNHLMNIFFGALLFLALMQGCARGTPPEQPVSAPAGNGSESKSTSAVVTRPADQLIAAAASVDTADALSAYRSLEQSGYCPYLQNSPETPVGMLAAAYGTQNSNTTRVRETIRLLVKQGCDIDQYNSAGMTPLHNAVLFRQPELLRFLVELGADPKLRVIHVPGNTQGRSIANLDAHGLALALRAKEPDDEALAEIVRYFKALNTDS